MSLTAEVYDKMRADLHGLVFGGNEFLNEDALAKRYGVSKAPVREALRQLCMEGVLVSYPRKGYLIASVPQQELAHVRHLRLLAEGYAVELAAKTAAPEALAALLALAEQPYTLEVNTRFHRALAALAESRAVLDVVSRLMSTVERPLSLHNMTAQPALTRDAHVRLANALLAGDTQAALLALQDDLEH